MMDEHMEAVRRRLGDLDSLTRRTERAEQRIMQAAQARLSAVNADLNRLSPRALTDDEAGEEYQTLATERGRLQNIIAAAQAEDQP